MLVVSGVVVVIARGPASGVAREVARMVGLIGCSPSSDGSWICMGQSVEQKE